MAMLKYQNSIILFKNKGHFFEHNMLVAAALSLIPYPLGQFFVLFLFLRKN